MNWRTDCAVVIPCLNEAERIQSLIREILNYLPGVIVVDDGSTDSSASLASEAGAIVLRQSGNFGKGAALRRGLTEASQKGFSWVLTMDGDGQHAPGDIPRFLRSAEKRPASLIVGNRMENRGMPPIRRFVNQWMSRRLSRLTESKLPDTQCGFRLISLPAWLSLTCSANNYEFESELLIEMLGAGLEVRFVPVQTIYRAEKSRIHPWRDTIRWFRWWRGVKQRARQPKQSLNPGNVKAPLPS